MSGNVKKYDFLVGKGVLPEQEWLEKATAVKRFQYSSSGKELTEQTDIANKKYRRFDKIYEFNQTINKNDKKPTRAKYSKLDLRYNSNMFCKYCCDIKKN